MSPDMFPFKKKSPPVTVPAQPSAVKELFQLLLRRLANKLSRYEQKMSLGTKKGLITLFCLIAGVFAMNTLYRGLFIPTAIGPGFLSRPAVHIPPNLRIPDSALYRRTPHGLQNAPVVRPHHDSITQ
jgi:hypothetical protein